MQLISVFLAAALLATVLGADTFCDLKSFVANSFDITNVIPVRTTFNADIAASLHINLAIPSESIVIDFTNGRLYANIRDGRCGYREIENLKALAIDPSSIPANVTIPVDEPLSSFEMTAGDIDFRAWTRGSGGDCELVYFAFRVDGVPTLAYVHDDNEDASPDDLKRVEDAVKRLQQASCSPLTTRNP
ncbi:hypothetical protein PoB_006765400 [Plakobranchus ocellatus]|uniref:Uncharacterized protein n=1 Tax=Plakobranchus ocellatus TaxID=259542 RepID=A0AAV4DAF2_9GAST|nr:hypothetical protein PoB_006765400 [Plakobranchus ocellatus]